MTKINGVVGVCHARGTWSADEPYLCVIGMIKYRIYTGWGGEVCSRDISHTTDTVVRENHVKQAGKTNSRNISTKNTETRLDENYLTRKTRM